MTGAGLHARVTARIGRLVLHADLDTGPGTLVVVGPNGAGKSSLLDLVLGVRPVDRGRVVVGADVLLDTDKGVEVPLEQRRIAYVPQDYGLFPHMSVRDNVGFALASAPSPAGRRGRALRIEEVLHDLGIGALADRRPFSLSGGEKQRVALARALCVRPRALLLDEPLAALDIEARDEVRGFLAAWLTKLDLPTVVVTHDPADASHLGARIAVLEDGKVTQLGRWDDLVARPASRFVERFVSPAR